MQGIICCSSRQLAFARTHCTAYLLLTCLSIFKTRNINGNWVLQAGKRVVKDLKETACVLALWLA